MKIAFVTNFYNYHQKPLADALYSMIGEGYHFIETAPISAERLNMGWGGDQRPCYILQSYIDDASKEKCQEIIDGADVVIYGSAPYSMIETRLKNGRLTFAYSERPYKTGVPYIKLPVHILRALKKYVRYKNFYLLCASAYAPADFAKMLSFIDKTYKWGYFTEFKKYNDVEQLMCEKHKNSILWCSRFIPLKHPEFAVEVAKRLKVDGYDFELNMIGNGELEEATRELIEREGVADCVKLLGSMKPEQVREHMEKSEIFMFTSDRNEGWGAVLNESMNSACAVVANSAIGSVPFLINDGENGYMYKDGDVDGLYDKIRKLLDDKENRCRIALNAYKTMDEEWNPENAAEKFVALCEKMLSGEYKPFPYESGVCSKAKIIKDNGYKF